MGQHPTLFCTATGQAWLATLDNEEALRAVKRDGFGWLGEHGPNAPRTISALLKKLQRIRADGYATVVESAAVGASAMAAAIMHPTADRAIGTVSIAGPSFRLTEPRMRQLAPRLTTAAKALSQISAGSDLLGEQLRAGSVALRSF
jgi:IclR family transcriptional regulator, acetate operon repressor